MTMIDWALEMLLSRGYNIKNHEPECVQKTPWSFVVRFLTSDGYVYLKKTPVELTLEPSITKILHDQFYASVPVIITENKTLHCFLMKDAGNSLRDYLKCNFQTALLFQAIKKYTKIQCAVKDNVKLFIDLGVPDWRLKKLPDLYMKL